MIDMFELVSGSLEERRGSQIRNMGLAARGKFVAAAIAINNVYPPALPAVTKDRIRVRSWDAAAKNRAASMGLGTSVEPPPAFSLSR